MASLSTHVLDTARGRPARGLPVSLRGVDGAVLGEAVTDRDGRVPRLAGDLPAGLYRLLFDTGAYFSEAGADGFYPEVVVTFEVLDAAEHYHVPLLLSPYGYSTYRGS